MSQQLALGIQLNDESTLTDFSWGKNELIQQQLMNRLNGNGEPFFYIWGAKGSGKTHLLQACCHFVNEDKSAIYLPLKILKSLSVDVIQGIESQTVICIDDIEAIAQHSEWEEAIFHLYNRVKDLKHTLIISGNLPPTQLPIRLADLRSRLSWGLVVQLLELDDDSKIQTLAIHANKRGFTLTWEVGQFLVNRCSRNMHDLLDCLNHLDKASLAAKRKITIPFVKKVLNI